MAPEDMASPLNKQNPTPRTRCPALTQQSRKLAVLEPSLLYPGRRFCTCVSRAAGLSQPMGPDTSSAFVPTVRLLPTHPYHNHRRRRHCKHLVYCRGTLDTSFIPPEQHCPLESRSRPTLAVVKPKSKVSRGKPSVNTVRDVCDTPLLRAT